MNRSFFILLITICFVSCSYLIKSYDEDIIKQNDIKPIDETAVTYCSEKSSHILINDNQNSQQIFSAYIQNLERKRLLSFVDKIVLWSLVQMNLRPDQSSASAKLQLLIKIGGKEKYYNSYSEDDNSYPYLHLLEHILKVYKSRYSLSELAQIYDRSIPRDMKVSHALASFLEKNQEFIKNSPQLKKFYIRGDDPLREKEGIPFLSAVSNVALYKSSKSKTNYEVKNFLFNKFQQNSSFVPQCNFDMTLYKDSLFLISDTIVEAHTFGMKAGENSFIASSSQKLEGHTSINDGLSFKGSSNVRSSSVCSYKNRLRPDESIWLVSSNSRDPGQHLYHLQEYGLEQVESTEAFDKLLRFSRHLFLKNPVRLVIESRRSQEDQIQELLKLEIPIYNAKKLGKIWGLYQNKDNSSFLLDVREEGHLTCTKR